MKKTFFLSYSTHYTMIYSDFILDSNQLKIAQRGRDVKDAHAPHRVKTYPNLRSDLFWLYICSVRYLSIAYVHVTNVESEFNV